MGDYWRRVFADSWSLMGRSQSVVSYVLVPAIVIALTAQTVGIATALLDVRTYGFGFVAFLLIAFPQFCWVLAVTPFRMERDRANRAEAAIDELEKGQALPAAFVKSLADSQTTADGLAQQLTTIAKLHEQYRRLLRSALHRHDEDDDLALVARFLAEQGAQMLPKLSFGPDEPLVFEIGWNTYRYVLSHPMSRKPDVSFPQMQSGTTASVIAASKIHFDVEFRHGESNNRERVLPQQPFVNARLR